MREHPRRPRGAHPPIAKLLSNGSYLAPSAMGACSGIPSSPRTTSGPTSNTSHSWIRFDDLISPPRSQLSTVFGWTPIIQARSAFPIPALSRSLLTLFSNSHPLSKA